MSQDVTDRIKVDLITLQGVQNYGSVLQALATQSLFEELGADITVINYMKEPNRYENLSRSWSGGNPMKAIAIAPTIRRWQTIFREFNEENLHLTRQVYTSEADFEGYESDADAFCTGSDQVWNSKWNAGILPPLYLSFAPEGAYKFAFSASFGQPRLDDDEVTLTRGYIEQYRHISVREDNAVEILKEQYGYDSAIQTADPTLCVTPTFWRSYERITQPEGDYILIYNLNRSREFDRYAQELAKKTHMELVRLCTRYDQFYRPGKSILVPSVNEFISLIDKARFVLTDSFHATAFSMNLGTEPICVYPQEFGGRLASFLRLMDSEQRHVSSYNDFNVVNRPVDFEHVNGIIASERAKARGYLTSVFDEIRRSK